MKALKNIVVVCDYGHVEGGAARIALDTAKVLARDGYRVWLFCAVGPVDGELAAAGVQTVCLGQDDILHEKSRVRGVLRGLCNRQAKRAFSELLSTLDPEETVIHVHTWTKGVSSVIFPVAEKKRFRVVLTVHDFFLVCPNGGLFNYRTSRICTYKPLSPRCLLCNCDSRSYPQKLFRVLRQRVQNRNIRRRKNVSYIFISEFAKREFLRRYDRIPERQRYFLTNMIRFDAVRSRVPCEQNGTYLYIGGVAEHKGLRVFCEAVTAAGVPATVVGTGILEAELKQKYPNICFAGWKSKAEMLPYMQEARCLIFPSVYYEVSPLTPLEVMAYGVPVICSDLNAASENVRDGQTGYLYAGAGGSRALAEAIGKTQDDEVVRRMSEYIFEHFDAERYSEATYLRGLLQIYEKVLHGEKTEKTDHQALRAVPTVGAEKP